MASSSSSRLFLFTALLLLSSSSFATNSKVPLALYYETLCPYSAEFIVNHLANIFNNGLISIVDLDLIPYGNARVSSNGTITCQHGEDECLLNTIQACAINAWPDIKVQFAFINCIETVVMHEPHPPYPEWGKCFSINETNKLDPLPIIECSVNGTGHQLDLKNGNRTNALKPPHEYVPWVLINGEPLRMKYEEFEAAVCKAHKGNNRPKVCDGSLLNISKENKSNNGVSYRSEIRLPNTMKINMGD